MIYDRVDPCSSRPPKACFDHRRRAVYLVAVRLHKTIGRPTSLTNEDHFPLFHYS